MKWTTAFALALFCLLSAFSWAQEPLVESDTDSLSSPPAETPPTISEQLRSLAESIEKATSDSATDWDLLFQEWTMLSDKLGELATLSADSEREMQSIKESQKASEKLLMDSIVARRQAEAREKLWRSLAIIGVIVGAGGVIYGLSQ